MRRHTFVNTTLAMGDRCVWVTSRSAAEGGANWIPRMAPPSASRLPQLGGVRPQAVATVAGSAVTTPAGTSAMMASKSFWQYISVELVQCSCQFELVQSHDRAGLKSLEPVTRR